MAAAAFRWSFKTLLSSGVISFLYPASFPFSHMPPISSNTHCVSKMLSSNSLDREDVISGFTMPLSELFQMISF